MTPEDDCGNCYDHCARCFKGKPASSIAGGDKMPDETEFAKYFEEVMTVEEGDPPPSLEAGWVVRWPGHAGIATGAGDTVSQCGYPIDHWKRRRAIETALKPSE